MLCRLCLINIIDEKCAILLFNNLVNERESLIAKLIAKYMHLDITQQDAISTSICQDCCNNLNAFHKFSEFVSERQRSLLQELVEVKREVVFSRTEGFTEHEQNREYLLSESTSQLQKCAEVQLKCEPDEHNTITEAVMPSNADNFSQDSNQEYISTSMNEYFPCDDYDAYRNFLTQKSVNPERSLLTPADFTAVHKRQRNPAYSPTFPSARLPQISAENPYLPSFSESSNTCDSNNFTNVLFSQIFFKVIKHLDSTAFQQKRGGALVQCCICDSKLKGSTQVTSNLIRHLKLKHPEAFEEYKQLKAKNHKETINPMSLHKNHQQRKEWQVL